MFSFRNFVFVDPNLEPCVDGKQPIFLLCPICEGLLVLKVDYVKCKCLADASAVKRSLPASYCLQQKTKNKTDRNRFFIM